MKALDRELTKGSISQRIREIAPTVELYTNYPLRLRYLKIEVINDGSFAEFMIDHEAELAGVSRSPNGLSQRWNRRMSLFALKHNTPIAIYSPSENLIVVNATANSRFCDQYNTNLAHELTHRGQHNTYPDFFQHRSDIGGEVYKNGFFSPDKSSPDYRKYQLMSAFIEADAYFYQGIFKGAFGENESLFRTAGRSIQELWKLPFAFRYIVDMTSWMNNLPEWREWVFANPEDILEIFEEEKKSDG